MTITRRTVTLIRSLRKKKERDEHHLFIVEGDKLVAEVLNSSIEIKEVFALKNWCEQNIEFNPTIVSEKELGQISCLSTPNKVLALCYIPKIDKIQNSKLKGLTLVLDGLSDPGNLGTIIRIADWFNIRRLICPFNSVDVYNPKVIQSTMGSFLRVNVSYLNVSDYLSQLSSSIPVYGMDMGAESIYANQIPQDVVVVIGNESHGISKGLMGYIKGFIAIPSFGQAESLNAAIATGILCSEYRRCNDSIQM